MNKNTIKIILISCAPILFLLGLYAYKGYNKQLTDIGHNHFKYAIVERAGGEQIIPIKSWTDFPDRDQIQFTSKDGITYLTFASRVILISDHE